MRRNMLLQILILCVGLACVTMFAGDSYFGMSSPQSGGVVENVTVTAHFAFVSGNMADRTSRRIFEEIHRYGLIKGAYIENLANNFPTDYGALDLMKIAIAARVDGIFLEGESTEEMRALIRRAKDHEIPVMTLVTDCSESERICFVETGNYDLGRKYGTQVAAVCEEKGDDTQVLLIVGTETSKERISQLSLGINAVLGETGYHVSPETVLCGGKNPGAAQLVRRRILAANKLPDVILCMNEQDTLDVYQLLADYNVIEKTTLIGCATSDTLREAVSRGEIQALIVTDAQAMAREALDAMTAYREKGQIAGYISLDATLIVQEDLNGEGGGGTEEADPSGTEEVFFRENDLPGTGENADGAPGDAANDMPADGETQEE